MRCLLAVSCSENGCMIAPRRCSFFFSSRLRYAAITRFPVFILKFYHFTDSIVGGRLLSFHLTRINTLSRTYLRKIALLHTASSIQTGGSMYGVRRKVDVSHRILSQVAAYHNRLEKKKEQHRGAIIQPFSLHDTANKQCNSY